MFDPVEERKRLVTQVAEERLERRFRKMRVDRADEKGAFSRRPGPRKRELDEIVERAGFSVRQRGTLRRTTDLDYWLQTAAVPAAKAGLIRGRFKELPVDVQARMDIAFSDRQVSFSYDLVGLRLERA